MRIRRWTGWVYIGLRTRGGNDVDMVDDRTGNGGDVGQEGIEGSRGHDDGSRPRILVWVATITATGRKRRLELFSLGASRNTTLHRRESLGRKLQKPLV